MAPWRDQVFNQRRKILRYFYEAPDITKENYKDREMRVKKLREDILRKETLRL